MVDATIRVYADDHARMAEIVANLYKQGLAFDVTENGTHYIIRITGY
jgi:hypothetical protein